MKTRRVPGRREHPARPGADEAIQHLYYEHYASLVRAVWFLVRDRGVAEEIVQEAYLKIYENWDRVREQREAASYLRSVAFNHARSRVRRRRLGRIKEGEWRPAPGVAPEDKILLSEDAQVVVDALRRLPRRQRECLVLRYYLDLKDREIAALLELSPGSVKTHLHRGLAKLSAELGGER